MCKFKSMIVTKSDVLYSIKTDSHDEILKEKGIADKKLAADFVKVELVPGPNGFYDIRGYTFHIDQDTLPNWWEPIGAENECRKIQKKIMRNKKIFPGSLDCRGYTGDLSALTTVGGSLDCRGYTGDLSALTTVGGSLDCRGYTGDLSALTTVGGYLDCQGYTGDLSALTTVGGYLDCQGYTGDLSALTTVVGSLYCRGYTGDLSALTTVVGSLDCQDYKNAAKLKKQLGRKGASTK